MSFTTLKRRVLLHRQVVRWSLVTLFLTAVVLVFSSFFFGLFRLGKELFFGPINVVSVIFPSAAVIKNDNGRTNILFLGVGPPEHDGASLTDTIMIASATTSGSISLISIPRDIYLESLKSKVNSAYALGGLALSKSAVLEVTGLPIHYVIRIDFSVFEKVINLLGGIDVTVEHTFDDPEYPIAGREIDLCDGDPEFRCRYENLHFAAGPTHMGGATALKFVRSRQAQDDEGTDFARARRQQLVIAAARQKVLSSQILFDPNKILAIYQELKNHIDTDIDPQEIGSFTRLAVGFRQAEFKNIILDMTYLLNPPIDYRGWILLPKDGTWEPIHSYLTKKLEEN